MISVFFLLRGANSPFEAVSGSVLALANINNGHEAWFYRWNMAFVQALRGNKQEALDWYEQAVEAGRRRYEWDELEPAFDLLRDEPRFQAALENQRQKREDMRARVTVLLQGF